MTRVALTRWPAVKRKVPVIRGGLLRFFKTGIQSVKLFRLSEERFPVPLPT